ncbi:TPA: hypothetical protein RY286_002485 [Enterobacter cloacae]|nr:hypothetical protein [Enterobacter cloacae]HEB0932279.1 hypothetical protein [Enterobacter cloacae]HEB0946831.1 hypothetical protein [Enterobacter cloacae]HEB0966951.1 hypothetical protein [Enterobacter cloacae]
MTKIYHQAGHNTVWNINSFSNDNVGNGLIFSPVHEERNKIEDKPSIIRENSYFDPQFYLPSSGKNKFKTYDFFPNTLSKSGFKTIDFSSIAMEAARACVSFQAKNKFAGIIIPARFFEQLDREFTQKQDEHYVIPFLRAIEESNDIKTDTPIWLTLPLTSHMVMSNNFRVEILNWVTSYSQIDGIYVFCQFERNTKQITDPLFLINFIELIKILQDADLDVIVGYTHTEAILYSCLPEISVTIGAFENTRMFSIDKFIVSDEERRGPKARIYLPGLLNWVELDVAKMIRSRAPEIWQQIYIPTTYSEDALSATKAPRFNSPSLYYHYFKVFSDQIMEIDEANNDLSARCQLVKNKINIAIKNYEALNQRHTILDTHGGPEHLIPWLNVINELSYSHR